MESYSPPAITELGSLHDLTLAGNKIGRDSDVFSGLTGLTGDIVPAVS